MQTKIQLQLRLVALEEERDQLKRQLRAARTALLLAAKARNADVPNPPKISIRQIETPEVLALDRRLKCLHSMVHTQRVRMEDPERLQHKRRAWYTRNKESFLKKQKARYERNKVVISAKQSARDKAKRAAISADPAVQAERARCKEANRVARGKAISQGLRRRWAGHVSVITQERVKMWKQKHADKPESKERKKAYSQRPEVKARRRAANREKEKRRWRTDPQFALASSLRCRIRGALAGRGLTKMHRTTDLIGCTVEELRTHLERQFLPGMTWQNRGEWHIDHKRPCASFDLTDVEQQRACFHFTNLQPLWKLDNLRKGTRLLEVA